MFKSLKNWLTVPIEIRPFIRRDGAGKASFDTNVHTTCYPQGNVTMVLDSSGNEVISKLQVYLDSANIVSLTDKLVLNGVEYGIKSIGPFYDGNSGEISILVVYL